MKLKQAGLRIFSILITLSIPVLISVALIRLLLTPLFTAVEYRMPYFPQDSYGFSLEERLEYGQITRRYLVSDQGEDVLRSLKFNSGEPLYLEREISHLVDVKNVLQGAFSAWWLSLGLFLGGLGGIFFLQGQEKLGLILSKGGWLTVGLVIFLLVFSLLSFNTLFTRFHQVFFEGDTWLFRYSDTLIRLFPIRFWNDVFILFGLLTLLTGGLVGYFSPRLKLGSIR
jgi:integral membrane protein (TIGR01906 family)